MKAFLALTLFVMSLPLFNAQAAHPITGEPITDMYILIGDAYARNQDVRSSQFSLSAYINGVFVEGFLVSPGKMVDHAEPGKEPELTPEGIFHPERLFKKYTSKQFGGKVLGIFETGAMPNSIFFHKGFAIHGSKSTVNGKPASKGCVRMKVQDSAKLFAWVTEAIANKGERAVTIEIRNTSENYVATYRTKKK